MNLPPEPAAATTLGRTVTALLGPGKGILAADESLPTLGKRFAALGIPSTSENRCAYRELLFTAPGLGESISGAILFDETMRQNAADGRPLPEVLVQQGIIPGVKVDAGTTALPGFAAEKFTQGLDGLRERLAAYRDLGARFTKWRAVINVDSARPGAAAVETNAHALALFAAFSQEAGLVPIVEPEVLMDGTHDLDRAEEVTGNTLDEVFAELREHGVVLEHMLLKTAMVLPGSACVVPADDQSVAAATLRCLRRTVPAAVPGIVFLSGGQSAVTATRRLNAICQASTGPWTLSFSFGRALQDPVLKIWEGAPRHVLAAQTALLHRARCNGLALRGDYSAAAESELHPTAISA